MLGLINGINVENQFCFLPHRFVFQGKEGAVRLTECNGYACVCCAALGCPLPAGMVVNQLGPWLADPKLGGALGWKQCTAEEALYNAQLGMPVLAVLVQEPTGHIALCVPSPHGDETHLYVSAAGGQCFVRARIESSFGRENTPNVVFYLHE